MYQFVRPKEAYFFFLSSRRRHTTSVSAFLLNRSSDLVKQRFVAGAAGRTFPPDLPVREYGDAAELRLLGRTLPSTKEIEKNPRARSAVLRAAEKVTS